MNIFLDDAGELIRKQMKDQGCEKDSLKSIKLLQPHIDEWINRGESE